MQVFALADDGGGRTGRAILLLGEESEVRCVLTQEGVQEFISSTKFSGMRAGPVGYLY
jgi:hypothetical protein